MDSEQKRRILDAHMHLPVQGKSLPEKKEILLKEMQKTALMRESSSVIPQLQVKSEA